MFQLVKYSVILWILLAISITVLALIIDKFFFFAKIKTVAEDEKLAQRIATTLSTNNKKNGDGVLLAPSEEGLSQARILCLKSEPAHISAQTLRMLIDNHKNSRNFLQELATRENERKLIILEKRLFLLGTFSAIAPLLGLLGTVLGMMFSFASFSQSGQTQDLLLSRGISQALITTAAGLIVAIPSLFFYNYFARKVNLYRQMLTLSANEVIELLKQD